MYAASAGQKGLVAQLVEAGADINARASSGWSALSRAALKGHAGIVQQLLAAGADASHPDSGEGKDILHHAIASGCVDTHALLREVVHASVAAAETSADEPADIASIART